MYILVKICKHSSNIIKQFQKTIKPVNLAPSVKKFMKYA